MFFSNVSDHNCLSGFYDKENHIGSDLSKKSIPKKSSEDILI